MYGSSMSAPALGAGGGALAATGLGLGSNGVLALSVSAAALIGSGLLLRSRLLRRRTER